MGDGSISKNDHAPIVQQFGNETVAGKSSNEIRDEKATGIVDTNHSYSTDETYAPPILGTKQGNGGEDPGFPKLPPPGNFNIEETNVGKWFSGSFLTNMTVNMTAVAMMNKDIHKAEGTLLVLQLGQIWKWAQATAELIMAKAEKEAAMHMALAIAAFAGLAVAVAGSMMTASGKAHSLLARNKLEDMGAKTPSTTGTKTDTADAGGTPGVASQTPKPAAKPVTSADDATTASSSSSSDKSSVSSSREGSKGANSKDAAEQTAARQKAKDDRAADEAGEGGDILPDRPVAQAPMNKPEGRVNANKPDDAEAPSPTAEKPKDKKTEIEKLRKQEADGEWQHAWGMGLTQMAPSINSIFENFIQMVFKPQIAQFDAQMEITRANKELAGKAFDSANQGFNDATGSIDEVLRTLTNVTDSSIKANSINSRGG